MERSPPVLLDDVEALREALAVVTAELANARAQKAHDEALIAHLKLQVEKLRRENLGHAPSAAPAC